MEKEKVIYIDFRDGNLYISPSCHFQPPEHLPSSFEKRMDAYVMSPLHYRDLILHLNAQKTKFIDQARKYEKLELTLKKEIIPFSHQKNALEAWDKDKKGIVCLPTGAGKTILAIMAIHKSTRSTLILVPTIDLLKQWQEVLSGFFPNTIGCLYGAKKQIESITVATYDTASLMMPQIGDRFGLLVFDECHHLPAQQYSQIAKDSLAPFRLGLSATLERADGLESTLDELVGEKVYEEKINSMRGTILANYDVVSKIIPLSEEEKADYLQARGTYLQFVRMQRINFSRPNGWMQFVAAASRSKVGQQAMTAYQKQKRLAQAASGKQTEIWNILTTHSSESTIIFTDNNDLAYSIGQNMVLPVLTHKTKANERKNILELFRNQELHTIVTSKVLNEGVDVPEASVAIVVSGSGTVREHVQRLGRILRAKNDKRAVLYELIAEDTNEMAVNERRRQHDAYQRPTQLQDS